MMRGRAGVLACTLAGCAAGPSTAQLQSQQPAAATPLAAVVAASLCQELEGRPFALASSEDGVVDTFAVVKRCRARADGNEVAVLTDVYTWVAVDQEVGAFGVHEFVHATVRAEFRAEPRARYAGGRLELTVTPRPPAVVAVEPVGALDVAPLNWASLIALKVAPAAGASPEAIAKKKVREEAERSLRSALAKPVTVSYDARSGEASLPSAGPRNGVMRFRLAPHGTALVGPFAPATAASARLLVEPGRRVAVSAVCRSHAERIIDADRRGDLVSSDGWPTAEGDTRPALGAMPCPWMIAVRAKDETTSVVGVEADAPSPDRGAAAATDRWVSIDEVSLEEPPPGGDITIVVANDVWRRTLLPRAQGALPAVAVLAPDEHLELRAERRENGVLETIADAQLPLDTPGTATTEAPLTTSDGTRIATVRVRTRVRRAEPAP